MKKHTDKEAITVSVWLGKFQTKKQLERYVAVDYSRESDSPALSRFWADYNFRADIDLQESAWTSKAGTIDELLEEHSYAEYWLDMVKASYPDLDPGMYNAVILVIGAYEGNVANTANTVFLGSYTFDYEQPDYMKRILG